MGLIPHTAGALAKALAAGGGSSPPVVPPEVPCLQLPLYYEAGDRTRFAYGIFLLNKDVEQLLSAHGLSSSGPNQLMANLYKLVTVAASALPQPPAAAAAAAAGGGGKQQGSVVGGYGGGSGGARPRGAAAGMAANANGNMISGSGSSSSGGRLQWNLLEQQQTAGLLKPTGAAAAGGLMGVAGGAGGYAGGQLMSTSALGGVSRVDEEDPDGPAVWEWYDLLPLPPPT